MPSFDAVCRIDYAELDNALNNTRKEIASRYDFRGSRTELTLDKKEKVIHVVSEDNMKMEAIREMFLSKAAKRGIDLRTFEFTEPVPAAQANLKRDIKLNEGIPTDTAKELVRMVKDAKMKVQASIQGAELRVSGKQRDDLQQVMAMFRGAELKVPLQFVNFKD